MDMIKAVIAMFFNDITIIPRISQRFNKQPIKQLVPTIFDIQNPPFQPDVSPVQDLDTGEQGGQQLVHYPGLEVVPEIPSKLIVYGNAVPKGNQI